ncbi:MAG: lipid A biosynthesis protein [Phycisphaeraceae bacterium]|nr:MAG: lipid A biosynthesis protein [Phycisphaeraceae bacterium]
MFRLFNITTWGSLVWIGVGLGGQIAFFGRMAIQWVISERERRSVVPPLFWYLSLVGGIALFLYFAWRQDVVGVLGQTTGVVIYARNIRLIAKQRRRDARRLAREAAPDPEGLPDPIDPAPPAP